MMLPRFTIALGCLTVAVLACARGDGPTAPPMSADVSASRSASAARREDTVAALRRTTPLAAVLVARGTIGPAGGEMSVPAAGARIVFPAGAVKSPTMITMTALAGENVAYDFQPHMTFAVPARVYQDLGGTQADRTPALLPHLGGAYFDSDLDQLFVDPARRLARVKELRGGKVDRKRNELSFSVDHFSGYLVSSGRGFMLQSDQ